MDPEGNLYGGTSVSEEDEARLKAETAARFDEMMQGAKYPESLVDPEAAERLKREQQMPWPDGPVEKN